VYGDGNIDVTSIFVETFGRKLRHRRVISPSLNLAFGTLQVKKFMYVILILSSLGNPQSYKPELLELLSCVYSDSEHSLIFFPFKSLQIEIRYRRRSPFALVSFRREASSKANLIVPVIPWKSWVEKAIHDCNFKDESSIRLATTFLHNVGVLVWFDTPSASLSDTVILDIEWLTARLLAKDPNLGGSPAASLAMLEEFYDEEPEKNLLQKSHTTPVK